MIIKCPHCRYKYEDEVAPGIQEVSCVCPRCAYPFTVQLSELQSSAANDNHFSDLDPVQENGNPFGDVTERNAANVPPPSPSSATNWQTPQSSSMPPYPRAASPVRPRNTGCCLKSLILLVIAVAGIVLLGRSCYQSFTADDLDQAEDGISTVTEDAKEDEYANDGTPRKLPKWVQGTWNYRDENGYTISVTIHGRNISETSGGETSYGKITYDNGFITAHFNDGHDMRYKVYKDEHVIDAGSSNLRMKKIE